MQTKICKIRCLFVFDKPFDRFKGFVTDSVLDAAGVLGGGVLGYSEGYEKGGEYLVAAVNLLCDEASLLGEGNVAVRVYRDVSAAFQKTDGAADAGLGEAHILADVDGTDVRLFFREYQYCFEIHLARFL